MYNFIRLPYAHLVFDDATMEEAVRAISAQMDAQDGLKPTRERPIVQAERELAQLHQFINRMSLRRFKRILMSHPDWELIRFHRYGGSKRYLPFVRFRVIPLLDELGGSALFLLRKSQGARIRRWDFLSPVTRLSGPLIV